MYLSLSQLYMAAVGALAYEKRLQIISNNLANANTVGFKQDYGNFQALDPEELPDLTSADEGEIAAFQSDLFWNQFSVYTDYTGGSLKNTGDDFDLAIVGKGFFCVQTPDGVQYTRKGDFTLNSEGVLVTRNGMPVLGEGGEITVDAQGSPPAAFICEPFYGNAGGMALPDGYLKAVYAAVRAAGGLAIADEVQVGYGRTGRWFWAFQQQEVVPDIVTVAKAMGNGQPLGAVITTRAIADKYRTQGYFFSSAGGSPVSCVVGLTVLDSRLHSFLRCHGHSLPRTNCLVEQSSLGPTRRAVRCARRGNQCRRRPSG